MAKIATFPLGSKEYCHTNVNLNKEAIRMVLTVRRKLAKEWKQTEEQITLTRIVHELLIRETNRAQKVA